MIGAHGAASLPMYDLPELRRASDCWWAGIARHLRALGMPGVPASLSRVDDAEALWRDPGLLFSQTCGYPLTRTLASTVQVIGTPVYRAPGCEGSRYASALVIGTRNPAASLQELRGGICAINSTESHSGCNVLRYMLAPLAGGRPFFARVVESGSHRASLRRVAEGAADLCAVDCVTHALLARHAPDALDGTRVLGYSPTAPGLPYITGAGMSSPDLERLRRALRRAVADPALASARAALLIEGIEHLPDSAYGEITRMEAASRALGYPELV